MLFQVKKLWLLVLGVVTSVFIPQTKYAEQWQPGVRLARPAVGCVRSLRRNAGVSWWSEQWREATLTPVRAVSHCQSQSGHCRLQPVVSREHSQLRVAEQWVALVWSQHPESGEQSMVRWSPVRGIWSPWSGLRQSVSAWEVSCEDWGLKTEDWGHFLETFCKLSAAAAAEAKNNQRNWNIVATGFELGSDSFSVKKVYCNVGYNLIKPPIS